MEINQVNTEMTKAELIKLLHRMESALGEKWKYTERVVRLEEDGKKYLREPADYEKDLKKEVKAVYIAVIIIAVLTALFKGVSMTGGLKAFLCKLLSFFGVTALVICIIVAIWETVTLKRDIKKYNAERPKFFADFAEANKQLEECSKRCDEAIALIPYFCPKECYDPRKLRKYISFFEEGRVDTIKEARNLFDEWMYRERMEQKTDMQLEETQNAIAAANAARAAAENAANTARQAKTSADWAAYHSRFK